MAEHSMAAPKILLIEDEPLIATYVEDTLVRAGFAVSGPFDTLALGLEAARQFDGSGALVDLCLQGDDATVVTEILADRGVPFIVMTGRDEIGLPQAQAAPILKKPFFVGDLLGAVRNLCAL